MKKYFVLLLLITSITVSSQDCNWFTESLIHDMNNIRQDVLNGPDQPFSTYYKESNNYIPLVFSSSVWAGGVTDINGPVFAGDPYQYSNGNDWFPGPLNEDGNPNGNCEIWDKAFVVTKQDLEEVITLIYNSDGSINSNIDKSMIPTSIKGWPGRNNPLFKDVYNRNLPDQILADFFDYNNDGVYNPLEGDLPYISNGNSNNINKDIVIDKFPESVVYWVMNANTGIHENSSGDPLKMELHNYLFYYKEGAENTIFNKYKFNYKGANALYDFYIGIWNDVDLGCGFDDFAGTSEEENMVYFYNSVEEDGSTSSNCSSANGSFKEKTPMLGFAYLKGIGNSGLTSSVVTFNASSNPPSPVVTDPFGADIEFYNNLNNKWRNGELITKGNFGYNNNSVDTAKYMFDGSPDDPNGWSFCSIGADENYDLRVLMNTGGVTLQPGETFEIFTSTFLAFDVDHPCPSIKPLIDQKKKAESLFNEKFITTTTTDINSEEWDFTSSFNGFTVKSRNSLSINLYDLSGKIGETWHVDKNVFFEINNLNEVYKSGIYIVQIIDKTTLDTKSYKLIVME